MASHQKKERMARRATDQKIIIEHMMAWVIFASRWLQAPLYIGLIFAQGVYVYHFLVELMHLLHEVKTVDENDIMLIVLGLIDVVMISNLLVMVIIGGYETFVSRLLIDDHPDAPEWLAHVNVNTMKIKLALALVGISSIHLLKTFIDAHHIYELPHGAVDQAQFAMRIKMADREVIAQVVIHCVFLISALLMAYTSKVTSSIIDRE